jgi:hypothetical protein
MPWDWAIRVVSYRCSNQRRFFSVSPSGLVIVNKRNEPNLAESQQAKYIFLESCLVLATSRSLFSKFGNFWLFPLKLWQLLHIFSNKTLCTLLHQVFFGCHSVKIHPQKKRTLAVTARNLMLTTYQGSLQKSKDNAVSKGFHNHLTQLSQNL